LKSGGRALEPRLDDSRFFSPFRPIQVSPIGVAAFFSEWGVAVLYSELLWIGVPSAVVIALCARRGSAP
jgi:inner membrane protein